ncbi:MAG: flagellar protein FliT [Lachnospiraceae bacterium]|nr:flagellar protein FliT [Lachnospiraceae bacterium]MEE3356071.1 flagellar protein FliT [Candidatus Weimeria sp.]
MAEAGYVQILKESLEKKVDLLARIKEENIRQRDILMDDQASPEQFQETVDHKEVWIDELNALDDGFQLVFERVRDIFEHNKAKYRSDILQMKEMIRRITDDTTQIRAQEQENYKLAQLKFAGVKQQAQKIRKSQSAVSRYYKSMNGPDHVDAQFLDKTK